MWRLDEAGRCAARALRLLVPASAHLVASSEPRTQETLRELAGEVLVDPAFRRRTARGRRTTGLSRGPM